MRLGHRAMIFIAFLSLSLALARAQTSQTQPAATPTLKPGVVVEKIARYSESEKAGLAEGDILLRWNRDDANGEIQSSFDLASIEIEQAPRGIVTVEGLRGGEKKTWLLGQDTWGVQARPNFSEALVTVYREGQELAAGKLNEAAERWRMVAGQINTSNPQRLRAWLFFHIAEMQTEGRHWQEADEAYQEAVQSGTNAGPGVESQILRAWGRTFEQRSDWPMPSNTTGRRCQGTRT